MILYALTDEKLIDPKRFCETVEEALIGGAGMIQFREKTFSFSESVERGKQLAALCARYRVPLVVNDSLSLAQAIGASGVHLGRDDGSVADARRVLGPNALIGASCYNDINRARAMQQEGASYVAFGACYPSSTKPDVACVSIEVIRAACRTLDIPVCCIGGITPENVFPLMEAGAALFAVCSAVFSGFNVRERTQQFLPAESSAGNFNR